MNHLLSYRPSLIKNSFFFAFILISSVSAAQYDVPDNSNRSAAVDHIETFCSTEQAIFNDVIVSEIHASPKPFTAVPDVEFLEIMNTTTKSFQLEGWTIKDGSATGMVELPEQIMMPGSYMIVCDEAYVSQFNGLGEIIGVDGLPTLNNSGDELVLRDGSGRLIFHVAYDDSWYRDNIKADGGWSLEMIDPGLPCIGRMNWRASVDVSGGTPGRVNSVNDILEDDSPIELIDIEVLDSIGIILVFDEKMNTETVGFSTVTVDNGIGIIDELTPLEPSITKIQAVLPEPLLRNKIYTLSIAGIEDCNGNGIMLANSLSFGLPADMGEGDVIINEILFNPYSNNVDFIELYNASGNLLSAGDLIIAEGDVFLPDSVIDFANLGTSSKLLFPWDYLVLTQDPGAVRSAYYTPSPHKFLKVSAMPNYPDDEGVVILYRKDLLVLDKVAYSDEWHYGLLDDDNGVSLERISPYNISQQADNWHSAASSAGFATPAYINSSTIGMDPTVGFNVSPEVFSPNGDGFKDFVIISYELDHPGYTGNVYIFDLKGRQIDHLVQNETLGTSGLYKWDGTCSNGEKARSGIFIVLVDLFDLNGDRKKMKKEIALTTQ